MDTGKVVGRLNRSINLKMFIRTKLGHKDKKFNRSNSRIGDEF